MIRFLVDDFGNLWRERVTEEGIQIIYPAPFKSHEDDLHDEWGSWKQVNEQVNR